MADRHYYGNANTLWINRNPELTCVYYLPEEHYIGICINRQWAQRMSQHRREGNHTANVEVLGFYERRVDAHLLETLFHIRGYHGFRDLVRK